MTEDVSCRQLIRNWLRAETENSNEINLPDLCDEATKIFLNDRKFMRVFASEVLRAMVYEIGTSMFAGDRQYITAGDKFMTRDAVVKRARNNQVFRNWLAFPEHVGHAYKSLSECTKSDLLVAAQERKRRGEHELKFSALWIEMSNQLSETEKVKDKFDDKKVQEMYEALGAIPIKA